MDGIQGKGESLALGVPPARGGSEPFLMSSAVAPPAGPWRRLGMNQLSFRALPMGATPERQQRKGGICFRSVGILPGVSPTSGESPQVWQPHHRGDSCLWVRHWLLGSVSPKTFEEDKKGPIFNSLAASKESCKERWEEHGVHVCRAGFSEEPSAKNPPLHRNHPISVPQGDLPALSSSSPGFIAMNL